MYMMICLSIRREKRRAEQLKEEEDRIKKAEAQAKRDKDERSSSKRRKTKTSTQKSTLSPFSDRKFDSLSNTQPSVKTGKEDKDKKQKRKKVGVEDDIDGGGGSKKRMQAFASSQRFGVEVAAIWQFETFEAGKQQ